MPQGGKCKPPARLVVMTYISLKYNENNRVVFDLVCVGCPGKQPFSVAHVEMMGLIGAGNNPMVGMTVAVAVAIEEASK